MSTATTTVTTAIPSAAVNNPSLFNSAVDTNQNGNSLSNDQQQDSHHKATTFTALVSVGAYVYAVASLMSWWFFLVPNSFLPESIVSLKVYSMEMSKSTDSISDALVTNIGVMTAFGFFHSLLARKTTKKAMNLPRSMERSLFCIQGAAFLHAIQHYWLQISTTDDDTFTTTIWNFSDNPLFSKIILALFWFGSAFLLSSTFALDHFHLFGLSQGFGIDLNHMLGLAFDPFEKEGCLKTRWHYRLVAHPIMTGMLLNLWCTPVMDINRFVCAAYLTTYIHIAVLRFEERTIRLEVGKGYDEYLAKTPRFFPGVWVDRYLVGTPGGGASSSPASSNNTTAKKMM